MSNQVVRVKREAIAACMTCPLCNKLLRDATTISECLHTFCRKCIYKKLSDEELECCPICDIDLGCVPLEKLRRRQTEEPELLSIEVEPLPTSTPTSKPTTDTSSSQGTPTTFWSRSLSEVFPFVQLEHFKLPGDDEQFNGYTSEEYLVAYIKAQCQANAILARAIRPLASATKKEAQLKTDVELLGDEVQGLRSELKKEKDLHADTRNKGTHTERQTSELKKLHYHLQQEYVGLDNRAKEIIKENELLSEENKDQEKAIHALEDKITGLHGQMVSLIRENNTLGQECSDAKQLAIKEYEESPALADKIMTQFTEGYEAYREKLIAAGLDVAVLDSSDEESEAEDDGPKE